jgi:hypothetical protein
MAEPTPLLGQETVDLETQLHATWWMVVKPAAIIVEGQPSLVPVFVCQTLAEATFRLQGVKGGAIVMNTIVFVNPKVPPILRKTR